MDKVKILGVCVESRGTFQATHEFSCYEIYDNKFNVEYGCLFCKSKTVKSVQLEPDTLRSLQPDSGGWVKCAPDEEYKCPTCATFTCAKLYYWISATDKRKEELNVLFAHVQEKNLVWIIAGYLFPFRIEQNSSTG